MEVHRSARRHGVDDQDIRHAIGHPVVVAGIDPDADPPKLLAIGPDRAGNLLEVVVLTLAGDKFAGDPRHAPSTRIPRPAPWTP